MPALAGTHRPSRPRSADAPAGPGPKSHLCSAPAAPAPRTPASRARLTASPFRAAAARGAPWPGPRCSSHGPASPLGPAPASPAPAGSAALLNPGPELQLARNPRRLPGLLGALRRLSHPKLLVPQIRGHLLLPIKSPDAQLLRLICRNILSHIGRNIPTRILEGHSPHTPAAGLGQGSTACVLKSPKPRCDALRKVPDEHIPCPLPPCSSPSFPL